MFFKVKLTWKSYISKLFKFDNTFHRRINVFQSFLQIVNRSRIFKKCPNIQNLSVNIWIRDFVIGHAQARRGLSDHNKLLLENDKTANIVVKIKLFTKKIPVFQKNPFVRKLVSTQNSALS